MGTVMVFSTWGALAGLLLAIVLIIRKVTPAYALIAGALAGGLMGGGGLQETVAAMWRPGPALIMRGTKVTRPLTTPQKQTPTTQS